MKEYTYIKANGIRKELQAINQTLGKIAKELKRANKQSDEKSNYQFDDGSLWTADITSEQKEEL